MFKFSLSLTGFFKARFAEKVRFFKKEKDMSSSFLSKKNDVLFFASRVLRSLFLIIFGKRY